MARIYLPLDGFSEDFSGWANYADFTATRTDTDTLFQNYYGTETESSYYGFDGTKMFNGNPSLYFVYSTTPVNDRGWYQGGAGNQTSYYARARVELASTFVPLSGLPDDGIDLHTVYVNYLLGGWDYIRLTIHGGRIYLVWRYDGILQTPVDLGPATLWYAPVQYVLAVEVIDNVYARVQVLTGGMDDALDDLTLFGEETLHFPGVGIQFADAEHFTGFWGPLAVPATLDFKLWVYTIEIGVSPEVDGLDTIAVSDTVRARTSYEVPLLEPVYETDFSEFADPAAFLSAKPWMFTDGGETFAFVTTQPFTAGAQAWRSRFRQSALSNPQHSSPVFSGGLSGTTSWFSRQVFELSPTFGPVMTLGAPRDGIRASQIAMYAGGSDYDYSTITLDGSEVRHVWDAFNVAHDVTTVIDAIADWKGAPVQVVHWVERITSTTVRVRIWFGSADSTLGSLPQIYDATHTSSFTDPTMYQTTMWSAHDTTEYPTSDDWTLWLYRTEQGTVNYLLDPPNVQEVALTIAFAADDVLSPPVARTLATITAAFAVSEEVARTYAAVARLLERTTIAAVPSETRKVQGLLAHLLVLRAMVRPALATPLTETMALSEVLSLTRAVRVLDSLGVLSALAVTARRAVHFSDTMRLSPSVLTFFGGAVADTVALGGAPFETGRLQAVAADGTIFADLSTPRFFIRADVADEVTLTPAQLLQWVWRPTVQDTIALHAGILLPDGTFITWATNTRTGATTNYSNYEYTSFAQRGTHYLATREDGLYRLDGDTDNGVDIIAELRSGFLQFAGGKFSSFAAIYLGVHGSGAVFLKILTGDNKQYTYRVIAQNMQSTKVRVGKGLRARYFAFELVTTGQDFDLDTVEFLPLGAQRRV